MSLSANYPISAKYLLVFSPAHIQQNASLVTSYLAEMIRAAQEETYSHPVKPNTEHP